MDTRLFLLLNFDGGPVLDRIMWGATSILSFIAVGCVMLFLFYQQMSLKRFFVCFFYAALVVLLADQTATWFKHEIPFLRPTHTPGLEGLVHTVNGYRGGLYGTVSGHAANSVGLALYGSLVIRKRWATFLFFAFAVLTMYSRIYLGVHFPSQIFYGILTGLAAGSLCYFFFTRACRRIR